MSGSKSVDKATRRQERKRLRNRVLRGRTRTILRQARQSVVSGEADNAQKATGKAVSTLDRAVTKGLYHRNKASRLKSRLVRQSNAVGASQSS